MKKCFFIVILIILSLCSCSSDVNDWKTINIEGCGTIKIPNNWDFCIQDEIMYITSDENPVMISYNRTGENESNYYFPDFKYISMSTSAVLSNSVVYGKAKYFYLDKEIERYYLDLGETTDGRLIEFLVWDEGLSENLLIEIAETFSLE